MHYSESDIIRYYKNSYDKKRQAKILVELNAVPEQQIIELLQDSNYYVWLIGAVDVYVEYGRIENKLSQGETIKEIAEEYRISSKALGKAIKEIRGIKNDNT